MAPGEKLDPLPDTFILQPPVFQPVSSRSGDSFCHNNFWWPSSRQDGHAPGSGPSKCTQVRGVLHGASSLPSGSLGVSDQRCPLRASPPPRFQVDFQCGCSLHPRPDIAIHFNPRFHTTKPHVICNSLYRGRWQVEARWPHVALQRGASFLILFLFGNEEMKVSVNGQHFLHYRYRLPLSRVDTLGIFGDISVTAVGFLNINPFVEGGSEYPVGHEVPCFHALPRGLWPGQVIIVRGLVLPEPKDFTLSLRDEAAHVPVTLRASFADRTLAWVSRWGRKKLILAPFLFYPQRFFEVLLLCQEGGLKLALNGQGVGATSLGQQVLEQLRELRISGSVQLYCVHY
ncbi:PREDICTED: galectin-12 isoform X2 [Bison bison bison]|uniref:Galectin n=1 Tax=Bison bison bison TaxID=43346 RepID=A0A6P3ICJ6_BISBB|nr:PREDICTED: galectin-12 isoform X2 [Bison bison bison]